MQKFVALVTGGASGIGHGIVHNFIQDGAHVYILDLPTSRGAAIETEIGQKCTFVSGDVRNESDVRDCIERIRITHGRLDVVVNSAGVGGTIAVDDESHSAEDIVNVYESINKVNVTGTYRVVCHAVRLMKENPSDKDGGRGVIVNIGSILSTLGVPGRTGYSGGKGCLRSMTLGLARDLAGHGIRVVTVEPGLIDTELNRKLVPDGHDGYPSHMKYLVFPRRAGRPDEVASLVQHIVHNKYINATVMRCHAGYGYC